MHRRVHPFTYLRLHSVAHEQKHSQVDNEDDKDDQVEVPGAEELISFVLAMALERLSVNLVAIVRCAQPFVFRVIEEGLHLPTELALIWHLSVGRADSQGQVLPRGVRVRHVVNRDGWVQSHLIREGPRAIFAQNFVVCAHIAGDGEAFSDAFVQVANLFVALDHDSAPVEAVVEALGLLAAPEIGLVFEASAQVAEEREEEVSLILVFTCHQLMEALLAQGLHEDIAPSHNYTLLVEVILLKEGRLEPAVSSLCHAVLVFKLLRASHAVESRDSRREKRLLHVVCREAHRHSSELSGEICTQVE
mmetsp:Transcript_24017/g.29858  ORF Transcript_24017/g.29858 Transcript_24017/m.29858 type:complete len:305 (-) Transcript_24017:623-1537(-)